MAYNPDPANYTMKGNPVKAESKLSIAEPLSTSLRVCTTEEALESVGSLTNLAIDALEAILRNPARYSKHIVGAANLVLQRKLGAVPDTVIQNNMQFIVKWEE